jgi:hypothetical protein
VLNEKGDIVHVITKPINELDSACMNHDIVYDKPIFTGKFETVNKELYQEFEKNK